MKDVTRDDMRRAQREVGENIPDAMVGGDDGDVASIQRDEPPEPTATRRRVARSPGSSADSTFPNGR